MNSSILKLLKFLTFAAGFIAVFYVLFCVLLYIQQDSIIFRPVANDAALVGRYRAQRVEIPSGDVTIEGWWIDNPSSKTDAVVVYFGGNMEDVLYMASAATRNDAQRMLLTNYRGYGGTPGVPSQQALFADALAIYEYAVKQPAVSASNVVLVGRSLGSGVATYVAANRAVQGVVLVTPFDSIAGVAQALYPVVPVRWLLKHPFPSDEFATKMTVPVLILAGEQDTIIPAKHAQRLFDAWAGPKEIHVLPNVGHNSIDNHPDYYLRLNRFLNSLVR